MPAPLWPAPSPPALLQPSGVSSVTANRQKAAGRMFLDRIIIETSFVLPWNKKPDRLTELPLRCGRRFKLQLLASRLWKSSMDDLVLKLQSVVAFRQRH